MSIVITCGNVRCELPMADLKITLPEGYKGNVSVKQEKENVITLDCASMITIKEEEEVSIVEPVVPVVIVAQPLPQPHLRIRTPPLPESPVSFWNQVTAFGLSPSPIPYCCPDNSPHEIEEPLFLDAPELHPPSLVETAPVPAPFLNNKFAKKYMKYSTTDRLFPGKTGRINKKKDRNVGNYVEDGELITHSVSTGGHASALKCVSVYQKQVNANNGETYDTFMIQECEPVSSLIGQMFYTLTEVCRTFSNELVKAGLRTASKNATFNGWDNSRVMRGGKMTKLSKIRDEMDDAE